ncbi:hypothetical protein evm_002763 [Chilo suppressalis]|nr:hypothetical protein evm_002763 [Chilo suppressalis]
MALCCFITEFLWPPLAPSTHPGYHLKSKYSSLESNEPQLDGVASFYSYGYLPAPSSEQLHGLLCLRNVHVKVPESAERGKKVEMKCLYDLEGDVLYTVKWYRGDREFSRYSPRDVPPLKVFRIPGIDVDLWQALSFATLLTHLLSKMPLGVAIAVMCKCRRIGRMLGFP